MSVSEMFGFSDSRHLYHLAFVISAIVVSQVGRYFKNYIFTIIIMFDGKRFLLTKLLIALNDTYCPDIECQ